MAGQDAESNELVKYLAVPVRRWRLVTSIVLLGMLATGLLTITAKTTSTATALVDLHQISTSPFDANKSSNQLIDVATEVKNATSSIVAGGASKLLSGNPDPSDLQRNVKVTAASGTTTLTVSFTAPTAADAANGANAFAQAYLESRSASADKRRQGSVDAMNASLKTLRAQLAAVNKSLAAEDPSSAAAQDDITTRDLLTQQSGDLSQRLNSLTGMSLDAGQIVSTATPGEAIVAPNRKLYLIAGTLASLIIGIGISLARESLDRKLRSAGQYEELLDAGVVVADSNNQDPGAAQATPDDALYVLRSRVLNAISVAKTEVLLVIDHSDQAVAGLVGVQMANLLAKSGTPVQLILVTDGVHTPAWSWLRSRESLASSALVRAQWLQMSGLGNRAEQEVLDNLLSRAKTEAALTVVVMAGRPRRSLLVAMSALADDVIVVAQAGYTTKATVRQTAKDVVDTDAEIFAGVLVTPRHDRRLFGLRFGRKRAASGAPQPAHAGQAMDWLPDPNGQARDILPDGSGAGPGHRPVPQAARPNGAQAAPAPHQPMGQPNGQSVPVGQQRGQGAAWTAPGPGEGRITGNRTSSGAPRPTGQPSALTQALQLNPVRPADRQTKGSRNRSGD